MSSLGPMELDSYVHAKPELSTGQWPGAWHIPVCGCLLPVCCCEFPATFYPGRSSLSMALGGMEVGFDTGEPRGRKRKGWGTLSFLSFIELYSQAPPLSHVVSFILECEMERWGASRLFPSTIGYKVALNLAASSILQPLNASMPVFHLNHIDSLLFFFFWGGGSRKVSL